MTADEIAKILDELGQRLGPTGSHVFELAVRQAAIQGWTILAVAALFVVATLVTGIVWLRGPEDGDKEALASVGAILFFIASVGSVAVFLAQGVTKILNPEYAAIQDIARMVTGR